jgi:ABC-type multidrug transport system fused ATPase/permease subunit
MFRTSSLTRRIVFVALPRRFISRVPGKDKTFCPKPTAPNASVDYDSLDALPRGGGTHQQVSLAKTFSILTPELPMMGFALVGITVSSLATMAFPDAIGHIIDLLSQPRTDQTMLQMQMISVKMIGIFSVGAFATFLHTSLLDVTGQKIGAQMRSRLFKKVMSQDVAFHRQNRAGELANRLSTDVHEVAEHLVENVASFLEGSVKAMTAVGSMLLISPLLTSYSSLVVPAIILGAIFYGKFIKRLSSRHLDALATSTHVAAEKFGGFSAVVLFGQVNNEVKRYNSVINRSYYLARWVAVWQGSFLGSSYFVGSATLLGVLWMGGSMVFEGLLTPGQLASFCMYAVALAESVHGVTNSTSGFLRAQGSGTRLFALLEKPEPIITTGGKILAPGYKGEIIFENVSFAYPDQPKTPVLRNFCLKVQEGELLAVTGRSGCGKSSILLLLQRLYDPTEGRITLDGVDIKDLDVGWWRSQIGSVEQEPTLFVATIAENIAYGRSDATQAEIEEAAREANVHDAILSLPNGYNTLVGERGASLSGGQKQRIAIARALIVKPRILALDEATSALDTSSEYLVLQNLSNLMRSKNVTTIVVSHHLSTLAAADRVAALDEGLLMEEGPFGELTSRTGMLQQLVRTGSVHPPHSNCPPDRRD